MNIGENIKAVREHHNMSQNDFAKLLNMTASAVSAWELGTREPRVKNFRQIAELFQIPMSILTEGDALSDAVNTPQITVKSGFL